LHVVEYVLVIALPIEFAEEIMFMADDSSVHYDNASMSTVVHVLANFGVCNELILIPHSIVMLTVFGIILLASTLPTHHIIIPVSCIALRISIQQ